MVGADDLTCPEALPWEDLEIDCAKNIQHLTTLCKERTSGHDIEDRDSDGFRPLDGFLSFLDDCMKCNSDAQIALQGGNNGLQGVRSRIEASSHRGKR